MKKLFLRSLQIGFTSLFLFATTSCDPETCKIVNQADLIVPFVGLAADLIEPGTGFIVSTVVKNAVQIGKQVCETQAAKESETGMDVYYRADANSSWQQTQFGVNGVPTYTVYAVTRQLSPSDSTGQQDNIVFADPGQYKFVKNADAKTVVLEENENNNSGNTAGAVNGKAKEAIVTVVAGKNYVPSERVKMGLPPLVIHNGTKTIY